MLMEYLRTEIFRTLSERRPLEEKWIKYQRMYRATPPVAQREFPFVGASNLVVPLIATDVDVIYSRLMGVLFQPENLWSCRALRPDMVDFAPRLQEFLQWAQYRELDAYNAVADFILELTKLGTGVLKQRYKREQRRVYQYRETPQGPLEEFVSLLISDHPVLQHVSLYDFLVPSVATNVQEAPWVAERVMMNYGQYTNRVRAGVYAWNDRIGQNSFVDTGSQVVQQMQALDRFQPGLAQQLELWEAWLDFDLGMGEPMAVVATLHLPSNSLVRLDYNPFFHQEKPYSSARFMRQEKRFYGIGIAEMLEMSQEEITAMHNQRIDTGTIANSLMMKARKGSGIKQDEPIFPGRWFLLDNLQDIEPINWGSAHVNSTIQDEMTTRGYATNRTGVNDVIMGSPSATSGYGTATGNTLIHQEAAKRFDQTLREVRVALGESGVRLVELYQQFDQGGKLYHAMGEKEGAVVQQILQFPMELIRYGVGVDVTATSASLNKESEIRTNTIIMQLMQGFYQQMIQGMMMVLNPQMPVELRAMVVQSLNAGNIMARRLLDSYGIQDVDQLIPQLQEILNGGQSQLNSFTPPYGAGALPPGGAGPSAGMAALPPGPQGVQGFGSQQVTYA
mgnify:CR=1 FL=1